MVQIRLWLALLLRWWLLFRPKLWGLFRHAPFLFGIFSFVQVVVYHQRQDKRQQVHRRERGVHPSASLSPKARKAIRVMNGNYGVLDGGYGQELATSVTSEGGASLGSSSVAVRTGGVRHERQVLRQCGLQVWNNFFAMEAVNQKDRSYFDDLQAYLSRAAHVSSPSQPANNVSHVLGAPLITHLPYHPPLILSSYSSLTHPSIHPPILYPQHSILLVPVFPLFPLISLFPLFPLIPPSLSCLGSNRKNTAI